MPSDEAPESSAAAVKTESGKGCGDGDFRAALSMALGTSFIDAAQPSASALQAGFLRNAASEGIKVIHVVEEELLAATRFSAAVAFITRSGVTPLLETLKTLARKNVPGRILTTDYLAFTDPEALRMLDMFPNLDVRLYQTAGGEGFHAKGWIFERGHAERRLLIGSANWTQDALMRNQEWNAHLVCREGGAFVREMSEAFETLWSSPRTVRAKDVLTAYAELWREARRARGRMSSLIGARRGRLKGSFTPNSMQRAFVEELLRLVRLGERRAILVSATGTGKTFAAAFAAKALVQGGRLEGLVHRGSIFGSSETMRDAAGRGVRSDDAGFGVEGQWNGDSASTALIRPFGRMLFLVHREQIAKQAAAGFAKIFGDDDWSLVSGSVREKDRDARRVFATVQTMSRPAELAAWPADAFDLIIIDEVHRAAAASYDKIFRHFAPRFWLGMTASPERGDGADVFGLFDHNIAGEVRLGDALAHDLLCPFHYFGITDVVFDEDDHGANPWKASVQGSSDDGKKLPAQTRASNSGRSPEPSLFDLEDGFCRADASALKSDAVGFLAAPNRVEHILKAARFYGHAGERVKGLAFVSRNDEAKALAAAFTARGVPALAVSGSDAQSERERAIERLVSDDLPEEERLSYLFSVDIFNEGVDIPEVNQLLLLRPTESPIVFVQQLGRGLRNADPKEEKDYLTVIDFIANYASNFLIPAALSGDRSFDKDEMRRALFSMNRTMPGCVSVHFDEVSRRRILAAIDRARTLDAKRLKEAWLNLQARLGRAPGLVDFLTNESIDPVKFIEKAKSYEGYLQSLRIEGVPSLNISAEGMDLLAFLSRRFGRGKRLPDTMALQALFACERVDLAQIEAQTRSVGLVWSAVLEANLVNCLTGLFWENGWVLAQKDEHAPRTLRLAPNVRRLLGDGAADLREALRGLLDFMAAAWVLRWAGLSTQDVERVRSVLSVRTAERAKGVRPAAGRDSPDLPAPLSVGDMLDAPLLLNRLNIGLGAVVDAPTGLLVGGKYTYEDACRFLGWAKNINAQTIGGYKFDEGTKTLPVFVNYDKAEGAIGYHDHFASASELVALSKKNRRADSSDARRIFGKPAYDVHLFVRKNKDDNEAKAFYYLGRGDAEGAPVPVTVEGEPAFEINYRLRTPVRPDLYAYLTEA